MHLNFHGNFKRIIILVFNGNVDVLVIRLSLVFHIEYDVLLLEAINVQLNLHFTRFVLKFSKHEE